MAGKILCFPNGYRTTSDRVGRINVLPGLSASLTQIYVEIFEMGHCVYRGLVDLDRVEMADADPGAPLRAREARP